MTERVKCAVNAINLLDVFCSCYTVIQLLANHSSAVLPCKSLYNNTRVIERVTRAVLDVIAGYTVISAISYVYN